MRTICSTQQNSVSNLLIVYPDKLRVLACVCILFCKCVDNSQQSGIHKIGWPKCVVEKLGYINPRCQKYSQHKCMTQMEQQHQWHEQTKKHKKSNHHNTTCIDFCGVMYLGNVSNWKYTCKMSTTANWTTLVQQSAIYQPYSTNTNTNTKFHAHVLFFHAQQQITIAHNTVQYSVTYKY